MTTPTPEQSAASALLNGRARWIVYVSAASMTAAWTVVEENASPHWAARAIYAGAAVAANLLAASNTAKG